MLEYVPLYQQQLRISSALLVLFKSSDRDWFVPGVEAAVFEQFWHLHGLEVRTLEEHSKPPLIL